METITINQQIIFNLSELTIEPVLYEDLSAILLLQKRAFVQEAEVNGGNYDLSPFKQDLESIRSDFLTHTYLKATVNSSILGSIRAQCRERTCFIGRLVVEPIFQKYGIGSQLLTAIEKHFEGINRFQLFTGEKSINNVAFYKKRGYVVLERFTEQSGAPLLSFEKLISF